MGIFSILCSVNHAEFGASMAIDEEPVAEVADVVDGFGTVESGYLFFVI